MIKDNIPKVGKWLICSASRLIVFYICVKVRENIERTRIHSRNGSLPYLLYSKGRNSKNRLTRVTVFVFCTFSDGAVQLRNFIIIS